MVEQMTGLPISHFSMECDHAPVGGMGCWDFGESALDFYDRACSTCKVRQPVGLPNLSKLITQRDEAQRIADARQQIERHDAEQASKQRSQARSLLRGYLDAVNQAFIDDLEAYDCNHEQIDRERLVEAARMAPERVDRRVIDLIFEQSITETLLAILALDIGAEVVPTERRTYLLAQRLFRSELGGETAAELITANLTNLADDDVVDLVSSAAKLASPDHSEFFGEADPRHDSRLLLAMWDEKSEAVGRGIDRLLELRTARDSQLVGRMMRLIIKHDPASAKRFVRAAASRYVRATQLLDDLGDYASLGDMAGALDLILDIEPVALDTVLQDLALGANIEATRNIAEVYRMAWRDHSFENEKRQRPLARFQIGLDRLTWLPSQVFDQRILSTVADSFRHPPEEVWPLIEANSDKLIGAALLIDEQITSKQTHQNQKLPFDKQLEQENLRSAAYNVVTSFLETAAKASKAEVARIRFIEAIKAIPEDRAMLRGIGIKAVAKMASDVAGLKAVLPILYSGMVGADVLGRAKAASALSEIPSSSRQNLPPLVYDVFCALLLDQFVAVHKSAVKTLRRISIPDGLRPRAGFALFQLVSAYTDSDKDDPFLVDCIDALARFANHLPDPKKIRDFCCHAALKANSVDVRSVATSLRYSLKSSDDFPLVVAHVLPEYAGNLNQRDDEAALIRAMSARGVLKHKNAMVELAQSLANDEMWLSTLIADALYRAGAQSEADGLLIGMEDTFGKTIKDKGRALFVGFPVLAYRMEKALASGDNGRWAELANEWTSKITEQNALLEDQSARDSRSRFSFPH